MTFPFAHETWFDHAVFSPAMNLQADFAGMALIIVAFAEKLAVPEMAVQFLVDHPELNVAQQIGIDMSNLEFARLAGGIEVLFGLLLISALLPTTKELPWMSSSRAAASPA